jgi:N-acetylglutamate synthase-like GNAT family acetyltransferase
MNEAIAAQIAKLLNQQNQLAEKYDAARVRREAAKMSYIWRLTDDQILAGVVCVKPVQWYQCEIRHLSVQAKRQGTGTWLLAQAYACAKEHGASVVQCTIRVGNEESEGFFKAHGFVATVTFVNPESGNRVTVYQKVLNPA